MLPPHRIVSDTRPKGRKRPLISVIVAVYEVERYIKQTLLSFKRQNISPELVEYILVDDGSTDSSLEIARRFAQKHPNYLVATKPNGGVAETRKLALELAEGEWVTSVDPDDLIKENYCAEAQRFIEADTENRISILSTRVLITNGSTGDFKDNHPLGVKFRRGNRVVSMLAEPSAIQMGATVFMRLDVLREHQLTYDTRISPTFEDGNLIARYLAHFENPIVGLVSTAHYYYRKRADQSSLVQSSWLKPGRYTSVPKFGYIGALEYVKEHQGYTPDWLANIVLYDLMWYFKEDAKMDSVVAAIAPELKVVFMENAREIFKYISMAQLIHMAHNKPAWNLRETLIRGFNLSRAPHRIFSAKTGTYFGKGKEGNETYVLFTSPEPHTYKICRGEKVLATEPEASTYRTYFGETLAAEQVFSFEPNAAQGPLQFIIDGEVYPLTPTTPAPKTQYQDPYLENLTKTLRHSQPVENQKGKIKSRLSVASRITDKPLALIVAHKIQRKARATTIGKFDHKKITKKQVESYLRSGNADRFTGSWLLHDHPHRADDNAEHLYRHLAQYHPETKPYFLLSKKSKDWERLKSEGFQLLHYGSVEAMAAARKAAVVASSDAVEECIYPAPRGIFGPPEYKFVFLQHGITKDDLSPWLNGKKLDLTITATHDEYNYFTAIESPYETGQKQVALTGFARYDALKNRAEQQIHDKSVPVVLIMPTWRQKLRDELATGTTDKEKLDIFYKSEFYQQWWGFLKNAKLTEAATTGKVQIKMLTHPSFGDLLHKLPPTPGIEYLLPENISFQEKLVEADIFLTDYSSLAFDAAYIGKPVAYFQFDRETMFSGSHSYRQGYYDYERDGFGPVLEEIESLQTWLDTVLAGGCARDELYTQRVSNTFAYTDSENCERIYRAIAQKLTE